MKIPSQIKDAATVSLCMAVFLLVVTACNHLLTRRVTSPAKPDRAGEEVIQRVVHSLSEIPPDFRACGASQHQSFQWFSRYCPPRVVRNQLGHITQPAVIYVLAALPQPRPSHVYADIHPAGGNAVVDSDDIVHVINAFAQSLDLTGCTAPDVHPCTPNGVIDAEDIIYVLDAFQGYPHCHNPSGIQPPDWTPLEIATAATTETAKIRHKEDPARENSPEGRP